MTRLRHIATAVLLLAAGPAVAADCAPLRHDRLEYTVCIVDPAGEDLRLFRAMPDGTVLGTFDRVNVLLAEEGRELALAMNAGMFHPDRSPVGLYVENGEEQHRAVASAGPGNFGLLPNGILCLGRDRAAVIETRAYLAAPPACDYATQSGPMLVIGGELHPAFLPDGTSRFIRNGVGVRPDGALVLAISEEPVTFHEFARLFRDALGTPDALYLDGKVSRLYVPALGRHDIGLPLGPILGVVEPQTR
ncbi:phosphodiester glycosidase family protein [Actibacterium sp. MT2.3-13A]|uniref:phosphodiester glycosidase family protein n=1 Tax=Actibacterium sp. MT2.3-13A TaxID=2828332 RepID=UPI001BACD361|nr:phosphodiester glycosidase family protein [Actibacterium sp. MT2.3-13A]